MAKADGRWDCRKLTFYVLVTVEEGYSIVKSIENIWIPDMEMEDVQFHGEGNRTHVWEGHFRQPSSSLSLNASVPFQFGIYTVVCEQATEEQGTQLVSTGKADLSFLSCEDKKSGKDVDIDEEPLVAAETSEGEVSEDYADHESTINPNFSVGAHTNPSVDQTTIDETVINNEDYTEDIIMLGEASMDDADHESTITPEFSVGAEMNPVVDQTTIDETVGNDEAYTEDIIMLALEDEHLNNHLEPLENTLMWDDASSNHFKHYENSTINGTGELVEGQGIDPNNTKSKDTGLSDDMNQNIFDSSEAAYENEEKQANDTVLGPHDVSESDDDPTSNASAHSDSSDFVGEKSQLDHVTLSSDEASDTGNITLDFVEKGPIMSYPALEEEPHHNQSGVSLTAPCNLTYAVTGHGSPSDPKTNANPATDQETDQQETLVRHERSNATSALAEENPEMKGDSTTTANKYQEDGYLAFDHPEYDERVQNYRSENVNVEDSPEGDSEGSISNETDFAFSHEESQPTTDYFPHKEQNHGDENESTTHATSESVIMSGSNSENLTKVYLPDESDDAAELLGNSTEMTRHPEVDRVSDHFDLNRRVDPPQTNPETDIAANISDSDNEDDKNGKQVLPAQFNEDPTNNTTSWMDAINSTLHLPCKIMNEESSRPVDSIHIPVESDIDSPSIAGLGNGSSIETREEQQNHTIPSQDYFTTKRDAPSDDNSTADTVIMPSLDKEPTLIHFHAILRCLMILLIVRRMRISSQR